MAKAIGALAAGASGKMDAIILTGGIAFSSDMMTNIEKMCNFIAPVIVYPGEGELEALADGGDAACSRARRRCGSIDEETGKVRTIAEMVDAARKSGRKRIAVAAAQEASALEAAVDAWMNGLAEPVLIGDLAAIEAMAAELGLDLARFERIQAKESRGGRDGGGAPRAGPGTPTFS